MWVWIRRAILASGFIFAGSAWGLDWKTSELVPLQGESLPAKSLEGKVVLVVNVASRCGYTSQYAGLQSLYEKYEKQGLVVLGVPCNQFMGQEPGTAKEIASFCSMRYGVTFPLLSKQNVNGPKRSSLYQALVGSNVGAGKKVGWNFEKFVVDRKGEVVARFGSGTKPGDVELVQAVEAALK
jgi:glutathione peroxidase